MASIGSRKGTEKAGPGITHRSIRDREIWPRKLGLEGLTHLFYRGQGQPFLFLAAQTAVASGADGVEHVAYLPGSTVPLHYTPIGAITGAMKGPTAGSDGLRIDFDAAAAEGGNFVPGGLLGPWRMVCSRTVAIPAGIFIRAKVKLEDVSGTTDFAIGIRKAEAVQAAIDNYDELACLNVISGAVKRETILNGGATVTVTTTHVWADGETHEIAVVCLGNGKVQFWFDGKPASGTGAAFQFDAAEVVVPFIYALQAADLTEIRLVELEVGIYSDFPYLPAAGKVR
jgi:hypothetical protein